MIREKGKYTVITGASSGIGYETAKAFAGRGKNLVIAARRRPILKFSVLHFCLSFPKSGRFVPSARKTGNFCRYNKK